MTNSTGPVAKITLPVSEIDEMVLDIESRLRKQIKVKGGDPDSLEVQELIAKTSAVLREMFGP